DDQSAKNHAGPSTQCESCIRRKEEEQAGGFPKRNFSHKQRNRQQSALAEQRLELVNYIEKADEEEHSDRLLQRESRQPISARLQPLHSVHFGEYSWMSFRPNASTRRKAVTKYQDGRI